MSRNHIDNEEVKAYFRDFDEPMHKQYLAMRMFLFDLASATEVAERFGYTVSTVHTLARDFKRRLKNKVSGENDPFFNTPRLGRKPIDRDGDLAQIIIRYRKQFLSVPEIKVILDATGFDISERLITIILQDNGFSRLPRRDSETKREVGLFTNEHEILSAPTARLLTPLELESDTFFSKSPGILCFLPIIKAYGIDTIIQN